MFRLRTPKSGTSAAIFLHDSLPRDALPRSVALASLSPKEVISMVAELSKAGRKADAFATMVSGAFAPHARLDKLASDAGIDRVVKANPQMAQVLSSPKRLANFWRATPATRTVLSSLTAPVASPYLQALAASGNVASALHTKSHPVTVFEYASPAAQARWTSAFVNHAFGRFPNHLRSRMLRVSLHSDSPEATLRLFVLLFGRSATGNPNFPLYERAVHDFVFEPSVDSDIERALSPVVRAPTPCAHSYACFFVALRQSPLHTFADAEAAYAEMQELDIDPTAETLVSRVHLALTSGCSAEVVEGTLADLRARKHPMHRDIFVALVGAAPRVWGANATAKLDELLRDARTSLVDPRHMEEIYVAAINAARQLNNAELEATFWDLRKQEIDQILS
jgi:hypothetical protein